MSASTALTLVSSAPFSPPHTIPPARGSTPASRVPPLSAVQHSFTDSCAPILQAETQAQALFLQSINGTRTLQEVTQIFRKIHSSLSHSEQEEPCLLKNCYQVIFDRVKGLEKLKAKVLKIEALPFSHFVAPFGFKIKTTPDYIKQAIHEFNNPTEVDDGGDRVQDRQEGINEKEPEDTEYDPNLIISASDRRDAKNSELHQNMGTERHRQRIVAKIADALLRDLFGGVVTDLEKIEDDKKARKGIVNTASVKTQSKRPEEKKSEKKMEQTPVTLSKKTSTRGRSLSE